MSYSESLIPEYNILAGLTQTQALTKNKESEHIQQSASWKELSKCINIALTAKGAQDIEN